VCRSFPLCSDMSADAADNGSVSHGVGVAVLDMAVAYAGRQSRVERYSTSSDSRR